MTTKVLTAKTVDLVALVKPRIMVMALLTAAGAMSLAPGTIHTATALWLLAGTALVVGSANTLNMWLERDVDCLMSRTKNRPLPQHRLEPSTALVFGAIQGALALPLLAMAGNVPAGQAQPGPLHLWPAALGLLALILYVGVYTPMKQVSHWSVWVGAIPGAMPALIGWTAATGRIDLAGLAVFGVLFFWQIPHTHAIGIYRQREYEAAGLKTLPITHGVARARRAILAFLVVQVAVSFAPALLGVAGLAYLITAAALGLLVLVQGFAGDGSTRWARNVFLTSIVYLPILFAVMVASGQA
ncbi:MAG TPA: heme o synthase [Kofleriaceae bacterium]|nr:heme o synthase [Kofleriaceae bacterium]